ncbi:hypothetical protein ACH47B_13115 [Rhodococcus sp. NPDC019627]|uniref:hypothetical protein n=1 Tax=unclassified Rhodococcus (in: high G+C Gram-positive bacteria) TaxID=192944 RepID=UPI0033E6566C
MAFLLVLFEAVLVVLSVALLLADVGSSADIIFSVMTVVVCSTFFGVAVDTVVRKH